MSEPAGATLPPVSLDASNPTYGLAQDSAPVRIPMATSASTLAITWQPDTAVAGRQPSPALLDWLLEPGLLTQRLRRQGPGPFRLSVLPSVTAPDGTGRLRRVILWSGAQPCVYAETDIPAATLEAHPWLTELGAEPLGETLLQRVGIRRSAFEFACLPTACLPDQLQALAAEGAWARRSSFMLGEQALTVTEAFLDSLAATDDR